VFFEGFQNFGTAIETYSMTFFIIADNPDIKPMKTIDKRK